MHTQNTPKPSNPQPGEGNRAAHPMAHSVFGPLGWLVLGLTAVLLLSVSSLLLSTGPVTAAPTANAGAGSPGWYSHGPRGGEAHVLAVAGPLVLSGGYREIAASGDLGGSGLFRSDNGGQTWQPAGSGLDLQSAHAILDVAASPAFTEDGTAFAATWDGLYRSLDSVSTWQRLEGGLPAKVDSMPGAIRAVALSPSFAADHVLLAAAADGGIYRSEDRGDTWAVTSDTLVLNSLAISPDFANDALVLGGGTSGQIYRSDDGGQTWATIHAAGSGVVIQELAFSTDFAANGVAFAAAGPWGMLRSDDSGLTWRALPAWPAGAWAQSIQPLAIPGTNEELIAGAASGVWRSVDGGDIWQDFGLSGQTVFALAAIDDGQTLLAGTFNGVYRRPAAEGVWQRSQGFAVLRTDSLAAGPGAPTMLYAGTELGLYRSADEGLTWEPLTPGNGWGHSFAMPFAAVTADGNTLFVARQSRIRIGAELLRSGDGGLTWTAVHSSASYTGLALSPDFAGDGVVLAGLANGHVARSQDGGDTWETTQIGEFFHINGLYVSPDFANDQAVFATGFGPLMRSPDGGQTWQPVDNSRGPLYGLAFSPGFASDRTLFTSYRDIEGDGVNPESGILRSQDGGQTWTLVNVGLPGWYEPFPGPLAVSPDFAQDRTVYAGFIGDDFMGLRTPYRTANRGDGWLALPALPVDLAANDVVAAAGQRAFHLASDQGVWHLDSACENLIVNSGFERTEAWFIPDTMYWAGYSTAHAHSGSRSMRTGIPAGRPDVLSYSSFRQTIHLPPDAVTATLRLWTLPLSAEVSQATGRAGGAGKALAPEPQFMQPADSEPLNSDHQYALILDENGAILRTLMWRKSNAGQWEMATYDVSDFVGRTIKVHMGTYNDGRDGVSSMYVDDVTFEVCYAPQPLPTPRTTPIATATASPTPSATATETATPTATASPSPTPTQETEPPAHDLWFPLILRSAPPAPTATSSPTPTATPTDTSTPASPPTWPPLPAETATATPTATATADP